MGRFLSCFMILGISLCASGEYFIEISPDNEADSYQMKIGDIVTFNVDAYLNGEPSVLLADFSQKVWWQYDKRLLEKVSSTGSSITLKATKKGAGWLSATTMIKNNHCQKKIKLSIIKSPTPPTVSLILR